MKEAGHLKKIAFFHAFCMAFGVTIAPYKGLSKAGSINLKIETVGDVTHFEFSGQKSWNYQIRKEGENVFIQMNMLSPLSKEIANSWKGLL